MAKLKTSKTLGGGCLSLFGLPFLLAGLFMSGLYFKSFSEWLAARTWDEVPCWIESAELKVSRGDDSDTYRATATYRYVYQGRTRRGDRVTFHSGGDNVGKFQHQAHRELSSYVAKPGKGAAHDPQRDARPFRCYVNPSDPEESVIYRTLRWEMQAFMAIFALTFPAVGAALVAGGLISTRQAKAEAALALRFPGEPWKWKSAWAGNTIPEGSSAWKIGGHLYTLWSGAIVLTLIGGSWISGAFTQSPSAWLLLIFPALWSIPAGFSIRRIRHQFAVGNTAFEPKSLPAWPGGTFEGAILMRRPPPMRHSAEAELVCEKSVTRKGGDSENTTTEKVWSHHETIPADRIIRDITGFRLPLALTIPADAPESGPADEPSTKHTWKLHLKVPGTPIHSQFEIPVFRTADSPAPMAGDAPSIHAAAAAELPELLAANRIRAEFDPAGNPVSIVCPPARHRSLIIFLIVFDSIWTAAAVFLIQQNAPLIFRIAWPVSAAAIWLSILWQLLHTRTVSFSADRIQVRNQLGPVIWNKVLEKSRIAGFSHDSNMQSGNVSYHRVRLEDTLGKKTTLVTGINGSTTAAALSDRMDAWRRS